MVTRNFLKRRFDLAILALVITGFAVVASQRLGTAPLPDTDESMMLQISYEMLNRGKLAFPMKSFYGGNIENAWHSLTPLSFALLSGFLKVFGWGLEQGRIFNLVTALLVLVMTYFIGRRLFGWQVGLVAIVLIISDPVFLARSRLVRYDMIAAAFALLAFYLYERAEDRERNLCFLASGVAAGAGVMCHTNALYMLCVVAVLMLLRHGLKLLKSGRPYLFASGALAAMSYEIIFAIVDYHNFRLQTRRDDVHFGVLEPLGWLRNLAAERVRYADWFEARGARFVPGTTLLHVFLYVAAAGFVYLLVRWLSRLRSRRTIDDARIRVLAATAIVILFFAFVAQRKVIQYVIHLSPWFGLCGAMLLTDAAAAIRKFRKPRWRWARPAYAAAIVCAVVLVSAFGYELARQNKQYLAQVTSADQPDFQEITTALRDIVPDGVCPVSIASGYLWLAFPEHDQCYFAYMEAPLEKSLDLDGKDYALIVKPKFEDRLVKLTGEGFEKYHLLGELQRTAYGSFVVYYTGTDPGLRAREAKRYFFFGRGRGYVSEAQVAAAREVWSGTAADLHPEAGSDASFAEPEDPDEQQPDKKPGKTVDLCSVQLDPDNIYQLVAEATACGQCELLVADDATGTVIQAIPVDRNGERFEGLFKTSSRARIRLSLRMWGSYWSDNLSVSRVSIRVVAAAL